MDFAVTQEKNRRVDKDRRAGVKPSRAAVTFDCRSRKNFPGYIRPSCCGIRIDPRCRPFRLRKSSNPRVTQRHRGPAITFSCVLSLFLIYPWNPLSTQAGACAQTAPKNYARDLRLRISHLSGSRGRTGIAAGRTAHWPLLWHQKKSTP